MPPATCCLQPPSCPPSVPGAPTSLWPCLQPPRPPTSHASHLLPAASFMPTECPWCSYESVGPSTSTGTYNGNILNVGMLTAEVGVGGNGEPRSGITWKCEVCCVSDTVLPDAAYVLCVKCERHWPVDLCCLTPPACAINARCLTCLCLCLTCLCRLPVPDAASLLPSMPGAWTFDLSSEWSAVPAPAGSPSTGPSDPSFYDGLPTNCYPPNTQYGVFNDWGCPCLRDEWQNSAEMPAPNLYSG